MLLTSLVLAIAFATLATWALSGRVGSSHSPPDPEASRRQLSRLFRDFLFISFAITYALLGRKQRPAFLTAAGFLPARRALGAYAAGFLSGALPVIAVIAVLVALGARVFALRMTGVSLAWLLVKYVLAGVVLVVLEEGVFRGLILGDLFRGFGARIAVVFGSLLFAVSHFLGVSKEWRLMPDPSPSGMDVALATFGGLSRIASDWPQLVGLFLFGVILSILRLRTGTLYLGMGVHAGGFWVKQVDQAFVSPVPLEGWRRFFLGTEQYLDGVLGWTALLVTLVVAMRIRLREAAGRADS